MPPPHANALLLFLVDNELPVMSDCSSLIMTCLVVDIIIFLVVLSQSRAIPAHACHEQLPTPGISVMGLVHHGEPLTEVVNVRGPKL